MFITTKEHQRRVDQLERFFGEKLEDAKIANQAMVEVLKLNHQAELARHQAELNRLTQYMTKPAVTEGGPTALDQFPLTPEQQKIALGSNAVSETIAKWCDHIDRDDDDKGVALNWSDDNG